MAAPAMPIRPRKDTLEETAKLAPGTRTDQPLPDLPTPPSGPHFLLESGRRVVLILEPLALEQIEPNVPYLLVDENAKSLAEDGAGQTWNWTYFGSFPSYLKDIYPVSFDGDPKAGATGMKIQAQDVNKRLRLNSKSEEWNWLFWAKEGTYTDYGAAVGQLLAADSKKKTFFMQYTIAGASERLCFDGSASASWNWAYVGNSSYQANYSRFTLAKFVLNRDDVWAAIRDEWPAAYIQFYDLRTFDDKYELIDSLRVKQIYKDSGLQDYTWNKQYFDCDDFSYVFKGQTSRFQYTQQPGHAYSLGIIAASSANSAHAANVFMGVDGNVYVIDYGTIKRGKDWKDAQGAAYQPYFVLM